MSQMYQAPQQEIWTGRKTPFTEGVQYYHQAIHFHAMTTNWPEMIPQDLTKIGIVGYACEEGVRRNAGRIGAKLGPLSIRKQLAKLAYHHPDCYLADFGDAHCVDGEMEICQETIARIIPELLLKNIFPIVLGGGHDIAYGHFRGIYNYLQLQQPKAKVGILNFDAHFDLRPLVDRPNSGTPFYQILSQFTDDVRYFVVGIQPTSNTRSLFAIAQQLKAGFLTLEDCHLGNLKVVQEQLHQFFAEVDYIYVSIDLDGFPATYAPGVSASAPIGLAPEFVFGVLSNLFKTKRILSLDIAELNPKYDIDHRTAKLAARLIDLIISLL